ncbi:MAG: protein-ADP-ribose hydrolase [Bacteroidales bacterium]|jgi:O-acetyl-ADP-ribose deacetylase (regulator of RNase III)|nr:protein-ADP-ribose hydrolase [Bacteroidales bacterium]MCI2121842.1 protein-ADP-ribose hydrolase [Bacteroidales bacterium]MCI2146036.1 protein-ADP-ribose hydrolase [Bacteroidales bacterium]
MNNKLETFLKLLIEDSEESKKTAMPETDEERKIMARAMMNVRKPRPISRDLREAQDAYLKEELATKGIMGLSSLKPCDINPNICLWKGDITRLKTDAIVNAANSSMLGCFIPNHNCIDNAIHSAAGMQLRNECAKTVKENGECETGYAMITHAYNLPCTYVIHTTGPIVYGAVTPKDRKLLISCYYNSLELCVLNELHSIAFPCISTGVFHYPADEAARVAVRTVLDYVDKHDSLTVVFDTFSDGDYDIYKQLLYAQE